MTATQPRPRAADDETQTEAPETPRVTHAMEDYLKAIYRLQVQGNSQGHPVTMHRLAEELGLSGPSVTNMVKRLHELGFVQHVRYRDVALTPSGQKIALRVLRSHRLLELYLTETLGFDWDQVHAEAERLEHHVSAALESRIAAALGHPTRDPHGDPIPAADGSIDRVEATVLSDLQPGDVATICRVSDRDADALRYLGELGVIPGQTVTVLEKLPFEGPLRVRIKDDERLFSRTLAARINVDLRLNEE